nr:cytochrome P450 A [Tanacetum cinerariifolium]
LEGIIEERLRKQSASDVGGCGVGGSEDFVDILLKIQKNDSTGVNLDRLAIKALLLVCFTLATSPPTSEDNDISAASLSCDVQQPTIDVEI